MSQLSGEGIGLIDGLVATKLCKSKGEARRMIEQGSIYVNNHRREGIETVLSQDDLASESMIVLRCGKRKYAVLRMT